MTSTVANIILSIINTKDKQLIEKKLVSLENQLTLNEVEKKIISDIREKLAINKLVSVAFIQQKYSYAFDIDTTIDEEYIERDAIDSAIADIRVRQLRTDLSKSLLSLGSAVSTLAVDDIKQRIAELHNNVLIESRVRTPENALSKKLDPYSDLVASRDGLSLVIPNIEKHAGKASKGTTVAILAAPGHFKTALALNIAYKNAMDGHNMLYLTLEDTAKKLEMRLVLHHIAETTTDESKLIEGRWIRDDNLDPALQKLYNDKHNEMIEQLNDHLVVLDTNDFDYQTFLDMETTLRAVDTLFFEKTGKGLEAVFIDHVSLLKYTRGSGKAYGYDGAVINDWVLFFNNQALNFLEEGRQITFFPLSQVKREAIEEASKPRKKGRYEISCPADASEIERISTTMITLFKDNEIRDTLLINIPKAREGFVPENPIQEEVHGEFFHVGPLKCDMVMGRNISADDFGAELDLESLIK